MWGCGYPCYEGYSSAGSWPSFGYDSSSGHHQQSACYGASPWAGYLQKGPPSYDSYYNDAIGTQMTRHEWNKQVHEASQTLLARQRQELTWAQDELLLAQQQEQKQTCRSRRLAAQLARRERIRERMLADRPADEGGAGAGTRDAPGPPAEPPTPQAEPRAEPANAPPVPAGMSMEVVLAASIGPAAMRNSLPKALRKHSSDGLCPAPPLPTAAAKGGANQTHGAFLPPDWRGGRQPVAPEYPRGYDPSPIYQSAAAVTEQQYAPPLPGPPPYRPPVIAPPTYQSAMAVAVDQKAVAQKSYESHQVGSSNGCGARPAVLGGSLSECEAFARGHKVALPGHPMPEIGMAGPGAQPSPTTILPERTPALPPKTTSGSGALLDLHLKIPRAMRVKPGSVSPRRAPGAPSAPMRTDLGGGLVHDVHRPEGIQSLPFRLAFHAHGASAMVRVVPGSWRVVPSDQQCRNPPDTSKLKALAAAALDLWGVGSRKGGGPTTAAAAAADGGETLSPPPETPPVAPADAPPVAPSMAAEAPPTMAMEPPPPMAAQVPPTIAGEAPPTMAPRKSVRRWTESEEDRLREVVMECSFANRLSWAVVASRLATGRTAASAQQHRDLMRGKRVRKCDSEGLQQRIRLHR